MQGEGGGRGGGWRSGLEALRGLGVFVFQT